MQDLDLRSWAAVPQMFRASPAPRLPSPWEEIFGPLKSGTADDLIVVGQIGQSLDGRVATAHRRREYINGAAGLDHLHRLRALMDAVVIGIGTALADDPQLTVRRVAGPNPARVVIDPHGRLHPSARLFACDGSRRLVVTTEGGPSNLPPGVELLRLPARDGRIAPAAILAALAERGLRRLLIEGGAETVSRFLKAGCLDRLHVVVAPVIIGAAGLPSLTLSAIDDGGRALRPAVRTHLLGDEVLFDCDLCAQRVPITRAKKST